MLETAADLYVGRGAWAVKLCGELCLAVRASACTPRFKGSASRRNFQYHPAREVFYSSKYTEHDIQKFIRLLSHEDAKALRDELSDRQTAKEWSESGKRVILLKKKEVLGNGGDDPHEFSSAMRKIRKVRANPEEFSRTVLRLKKPKDSSARAGAGRPSLNLGPVDKLERHASAQQTWYRQNKEKVIEGQRLRRLKARILDYVRTHGRVTTRDMVREYGASPNTLKVTFASLVEKGLLVRHGAGRSTWYGLP